MPASQQTTYTNGMTLTHTILNSEFGEIYTWLNTQEYIKNLIATDIGKFLEFDNTYGVGFENVAGTLDAKIFQNTDDDLEIHLNTAGQALIVSDHADADLFSVDDSNKTVNAWQGGLIQAWDSGNVDYGQLKHDGTDFHILTGGAGGGDIILDPAGGDVVPGSDSADNFGKTAVRWATGYFDALDAGGTITGGTLTDGTASLTSGALTSATTGAFSGAVTVGSLASSGAVSGTTATFTGLTHVNGSFLRITNNSDVFDIDCDGTDVVMNASAGVSVIKGNKAFSGNGAYINHSDKRLKKNIKTATPGLNEILKLKPKTFERKGDAFMGIEIGFVAQDVEKVLPDAVYTHGDKEKTKGIATDNIIPVLVNAIKELNAKVDAA